MVSLRSRRPQARGAHRDDFHNLPPAPNNPVGILWVGLNRPGIGIHGSPAPDTMAAPEAMAASGYRTGMPPLFTRWSGKAPQSPSGETAALVLSTLKM